MKKIISLFLAIIMLFSLVACGGGAQKDGDSSSGSDIKHTGKKIKGDILAASYFSEGLAFVELAEEKGKTYCINKKGYIVFELDIDLSTNGDIGASFVNGLAYVKEGICDTTGKVTKPEDVGATNFYFTSTLKEGYILADVISSDYSSTSKKFGVLNTKFEWTVEPSEKLYKEFSGEYSFGIDNVLNSSNYAFGDIFYCTDLEKALNMKTGEIIKDKDKMGTPDSSVWKIAANSSGYKGYYLPDASEYVVTEENLIIDLTKNGNVCKATSFVNGRAAVVYHNRDANRYYVTMIDESGKHIFEPVETKYSQVQTDGKYVMVTNDDDYAEIFNDKGEKMGEIDVSEDSSMSYHLYLEDGVVLVRAGVISMMSGYRGKAYYLDVKGKNLF